MRKRIVTATLLCGLLAGVGFTALGQEAAQRPSWDCLPETTSFALRIPDGQAVYDDFKNTTKLGSVLFSDERIKKIREIISEHEAWAEGVKELEKYGLTPDDLLQCLTGESGIALVLDDSEEPLWIGLGWLAPGDELASRLHEAIAEMIEKQDDEEHPIKRTDIDIDGQDVMFLTLPEIQEAYGDDAFDLPDNFAELDAEEREKAIQQASEEAEENVETSLAYTHLLLANLDGRIVVGVTMDATEDAEPKELIGRLTATFSQFLAAHSGDAESTFASRIEATQGVREALPQSGKAFFEIYGDLRPLLELAAEEAEDVPFDVPKLIESLGVDRLGVMAMRVSLHESLMHLGAFVEVPTPRTGIMTVLDQPELDPEPPAWVPASILEYGHFSLDLGGLYKQIKDIAIANAGDQAKMQFQQIELPVKAMAGSDLASILSSLGHRHTLVSFEPRMRKLEVLDEEMEVLSERMAFVWRIKDEELWRRLLQAGQAYTAMMGDSVKYGSAQGFEGYRMTSEMMEGGLYLGKGYLVLGMGEDVIDQMLALLNKPPTGKDALRNSDTFKRATNLIRLEPGMSFDFTDDSRYAGLLKQMMEPMLEEPDAIMLLFAEDDDDPDPEAAAKLAEQVRELMPTDDELEGIFGVSAGYVRTTDRGLVVKSISELPR